MLLALSSVMGGKQRRGIVCDNRRPHPQSKEHQLHHSSQLLPQGNVGFMWRNFPIPVQEEKSEIYMFIWNLPISKHWTFKMNKKCICPIEHMRTEYKTKGCHFESSSGFAQSFLFHTPEPPPIGPQKEVTCNLKSKKQVLTMELLKATGGCELSQRPTDLCLEWPWMGTWALWHLLRGWAHPWPLRVAGPWAHWAGKDRHWYWVHSSLSESSSLGVSSRLAARKESCYCTSHTLAKSRSWGYQTLEVEERTQGKSTLLLWNMGNWATLTGERGVQLSCTDSNPVLLLPSYVTELWLNLCSYFLH